MMERHCGSRRGRWLAASLLGLSIACSSSAENGEQAASSVRDLVYARYGSRELRLDLYLPDRNPGEPVPAVVAIRGGGWRRGDKEALGPMAAALADRGLAAASIEYRAASEARFPAALEDAKAAVRWLRTHGPEHGIDPDAIGVIGGSAGAHLAVLAATTSDVEELEPDGGDTEVSSRVQAVVAMATPVNLVERPGARAIQRLLGVRYQDDPELWVRASPISHVDASDPPMFLIHSRSDPVVPFDQSLKLARKLTEVGVRVETMWIDDAPHAFWNRARWQELVVDRAAQFFRDRLMTRR